MLQQPSLVPPPAAASKGCVDTEDACVSCCTRKAVVSSTSKAHEGRGTAAEGNRLPACCWSERPYAHYAGATVLEFVIRQHFCNQAALLVTGCALEGRAPSL